MNFRRIKHTLKRLSMEEKIIGLGSIIVIIGCFLPWYNSNNIVSNQGVIEYGLTGDLGVIGFVILLMSFLGMLAMISENMRLPFPKFGYKRESVVFFFIGQSAFLTLLTMAIYMKRAFIALDADLRFGLYLVLTASFLSALAAFSLIRKTRQKEVVELFTHEDENIEPQPTEIEGLDESQSEEKANEGPLNFEEDQAILDEIDEAFGDTTASTASPSAENEVKEEEKNVSVTPSVPTPVTNEQKEEVSPKPTASQTNYFTREAGIQNKAEKKEGESSLGGFYNDK